MELRKRGDCMNCRKCGNCCRVIAIRVPVDDKLFHEYFSARGLKTDPDRPDMVLIPSVCQYLKYDNTCQIYDVRPEICRTYPNSSQSYLPEGCVYRGDKSAT